MHKVPKIFEIQTIQLTENGLKRAKRAGRFIEVRALKFLISHIGTKLISLGFYFYLKTMPILWTIQIRILIKKIFTSLIHYSLYIQHISHTKNLCQKSFTLPTICQGFPNSCKGWGEFENFAGRILMIRTFFKVKNSLLRIVNIN